MWIYVVEDEEVLRLLIVKYLEKEGYQVKSFAEGEAALQAVHEEAGLWVIDIMLQDIDGLTVFREVKKARPDVCTIFISARNQDIDRVTGLELGCDDYIPKPFLIRELIIRVNKLLQKQKTPSSLLHIPPYSIDRERHMVFEGRSDIELTAKEYDLLLFLMQHRNSIVKREQILNHVWGYGYFGSDRVVDDMVRRLRKKLGHLDIRTVYGFGYRLNTQQPI
ncbi:MAG: response regulator transcription factor [Anaerolineaceae bacterium]|nr:response regulator transcription factor [Anaerolineaceae bacterium]